jgi:preprotein translocase subunit SecB
MKKENEIRPAGLFFHHFRVTESHWTAEMTNEEGTFTVDIDPAGELDKSKKTFLLRLNCKIAVEGKFNASVKVEGFFGYNEWNESLDGLLYTNAPALLFPHIRAYLAALTALSGLQTLLIPPLNLSGLKTKLRENVVEIE